MLDLASCGLAISDINQMNVLELENALIWANNLKARQSERLVAGFQYHLLAQNKKTISKARGLVSKITKIKPLNHRQRTMVFETIAKLKNLKALN